MQIALLFIDSVNVISLICNGVDSKCTKYVTFNLQLEHYRYLTRHMGLKPLPSMLFENDRKYLLPSVIETYDTAMLSPSGTQVLVGQGADESCFWSE